jgi:hypothetical protein
VFSPVYKSCVTETCDNVLNRYKYSLKLIYLKFFSFESIQNGSGAHPTSHSTSTTGSFPGGEMTGEHEDHSHVVPKLPTCGAIPPLSQCASMVCTGTFKSGNISINIRKCSYIFFKKKSNQINADKPLFVWLSYSTHNMTHPK